MKVVDLTHKASVHRELALFRVKAKPNERGEVFQVADVFRATVMDVGRDSMVLEITGTQEIIDDFAAVLSPYNVTETARRGLVSVEKSTKYSKKNKLPAF